MDIDTLRADHLGCYGYARDTSPNIDAFAERGMLFEWAFSQAPNTPPSQTSILTGLYPSTHGMVLNGDRVREDIVTLAESLAAEGYVTAAWVDGGYMQKVFGLLQGFEGYRNSRLKGLKVSGPEVRRWVRKHASETFLLLVHTYDVHTPYNPPEPYRSMFLDGLAEPTPGFSPTPEVMTEVRHHKRSLTANDVAYAKALYDGGIRYVDAWVGRFLRELEELGLDQRAIVVIISDHGEEFMEHGSVGHAKLYTTVTHIPFIIRDPELAGGRRIPNIVESIDLMPTLLELSGVGPPRGLQGESLVPLLLHDLPEDEGRAFGESPFFGKRRFVAQGDYMMLYTVGKNSAELFDFRRDPLEQADLSEEEEDRVEGFRGMLAEWEESVAVSRERKPVAGNLLGAEVREQLKTLGYTQ